MLLCNLLILVTGLASLEVHAVERHYEVQASAFCKLPDLPGRSAWSSTFDGPDANFTYKMWQSQAMIPWHHNVTNEEELVLEQLTAHQMMLSNSQVAQGTTASGNGPRVRRFCQKLLAGQAVTVLLLGGSWTSGSGVQNPTNSWAANFFAWINATFPHSDHVLVNNSTRGVTSGYVELCLHTYVIQDADLVVLEFDVNDGFHDRIEQQTRQDMPWWEDHFDSPTRRAFERMLRGLMILPSTPAIIYMHAHIGGSKSEAKFYWGIEDHYDTILAYYGLVSLSMRNSLHTFLIRDPHMHSQIWPTSDGHPSCYGTRLFADLIIAHLTKHSMDTVWSGLHHYDHNDHSRQYLPERIPADPTHFKLPPPLFSNNSNSPSKCLLERVQMEEMMISNQGFEWTNEGTQANSRWGFVSNTMQDAITLQIQSRGHESDDSTIVVGFSLLVSYESMGLLDVTCSQGCTCSISQFDTCKADISWSEVSWAFHHVKVTSQTEACLVTLTNSGAGICKAGHKLKLIGLMLTDASEVLSLMDLSLRSQSLAGSV